MTHRSARTADRWDGYVESFHQIHAGITERLLRRARFGDLDPYQWLIESAPTTGGVVLDVACGSGPVAAHLRPWIGVDRSDAELAEARAAGRDAVVRAVADALPMRSGSVDVAIVAMSLQVLGSLDHAMAELARVVRPGGQLLLLLPARRPLPIRDALFYVSLQGRLRRWLDYPNDPRLHSRQLRSLARDHAFEVEDDQRAGFRVPLRNRGDAEELVRSLYLPAVPEIRIDRAVKHVSRRVGESLAIPLRRVVLRRR